jgi:adhesin/invasin
MKYAVRSLLLSVLLVVAALSCDKATPTAPSGSTLAISANPSRIGLNGSSTITIIGRQPNGSVMREGTEVRLSSSLGNITPLVLIDRDGNATATLRGDGRKGAATVTAQTGTSGGGSGAGGATGGSSSGSLSVTTTVQIGETDDTKPALLISANPNVIPVGGSSTITVIARNSDGSPVASGQEVLLTTTLGTLQPRRPTTNSNGTATSTLTVDSQAGTAKISAVLGTSNAESTEIQVKDATLTLTANPASVDEGTRNVITLTAVLTNFQGGGVAGKTITFSSQRGTLSASTAVTQANGEASVQLTLEPQQVSANESFTVTATTPSSSGESLTATVTITIRFVPS